jgi:hypothetical protein
MDRTAGGVRGGAAMDVDVMPSGWVLYSGLMILFTGVWNTFEGIFAFFRSTYFIGHAAFGDIWFWAIVWTAFGVLLIAAGSAIMMGQAWARWVAIIVVLINAFIHLMSIGTYPWWSVVMIAIDITIIYGLTARWESSTELAA